jgi:ATP-dependent Lhr-like helicase
VLAGQALFGFGVPWLIVAAYTLIQRRSPAHLQGRVYSAMEIAIGLPQTLSIALGAALVTVIDYRLLILLEAAVTAASARSGQCEPLALPDAPLDVLCQQLLGMAATRSWAPDEAYELVRRSTPFAGLARADFDDCLAYLRGLGRDGKPWLPPRLRDDGDCFRIRDARTARLLRRNLGTILEEESVPVVLRGAGCQPAPDGGQVENLPYAVGEVAEAFADRLEPGDRFLLDGRCLEYRAREEGALWVEEVAGRPQVPRWAGEGWPLSPELARRLYVLRVQAVEALRESPAALASLLRRDYGLDAHAAEMLVDFFVRQECVSEVPDGEGVLVEVVAHPGAVEYAVHTPLNRAGNDALARVAVARLARDEGRSAASVVADLGFLLRVRGGLPGEPPEALRRLLSPEGFAEDLDAALAWGRKLARATTLPVEVRPVAEEGP